MKFWLLPLVLITVLATFFSCGSDDDDNSETPANSANATQANAAVGGVTNLEFNMPGEDSGASLVEMRRQLLTLRSNQNRIENSGAARLQDSDIEFDVCELFTSDEVCASLEEGETEDGQTCTYTCGDSLAASCVIEEQSSACGEDTYTSSGKFDYNMGCTTLEGESTFTLAGTVDIAVAGSKLASNIAVQCEMNMVIDSNSSAESEGEESDEEEFDCDVFSCKINGTAVSCEDMQQAASTCE